MRGPVKKKFEDNWLFEVNTEDDYLVIQETYNDGSKHQEVVLSVEAYKALVKFVKIKERFSE